MKRLDPVLAYYILKSGHAFFFTMVVSVSLIFQTSEAGLSPLQLLIVGTALQGTILVSEVPTGIVADTYGRKRSVVIGLLLMGSGMGISGAVAEFAPIFVGHMVWGLGHTFISGAGEAWIADEIGIERANRVYLRSAQITKIFWIAAIPVAFGIAAFDLNLPILIAGACFLGLALFLLAGMAETGFRPGAPEAGQTRVGIGQTLAHSTRLVRSSPLLLTILVIMAFYGMAGQGFERLWVAHFESNIRFPSLWSLDSLMWFGALRMGAALVSMAAVESVRHWGTRIMTSHSAVSRTLFWINALQMFSILILATTGNFAVAAVCFCLAVALSEAYDPLQLAWINQNVESRVRATVISMSSQMEAFGKTAGGPPLGVIANVLSLRSALAFAGLAIFPALLFYVRAFGQRGRVEVEPERPGV